MTEAVLRDCFEAYGEIDHVSIRSHKYSEAGMQGGYGFLTFRTSEQNKAVVDRVRQTIINDILFDCSWSESHTQKVLGAEAAADYRLQESKILGGRPTTRTAASRPVPAHESLNSGSAYGGMPYPSAADYRTRAYPPQASYPRGYDSQLVSEPMYESPYDRRYPTDPRYLDDRVDYGVQGRSYGAMTEREALQYEYARRGMLPPGTSYGGSHYHPHDAAFSKMRPEPSRYEDPYDLYSGRRSGPVPSGGYDPRLEMSAQPRGNNGYMPPAVGYDDYDLKYGRVPAGHTIGRGGHPLPPGPAGNRLPGREYFPEDPALRYRGLNENTRAPASMFPAEHSLSDRTFSGLAQFGKERVDPTFVDRRAAPASGLYGQQAGRYLDEPYFPASSNSVMTRGADYDALYGGRFPGTSSNPSLANEWGDMSLSRAHAPAFPGQSGLLTGEEARARTNPNPSTSGVMPLDEFGLPKGMMPTGGSLLSVFGTVGEGSGSPPKSVEAVSSKGFPDNERSRAGTVTSVGSSSLPLFFMDNNNKAVKSKIGDVSLEEELGSGNDSSDKFMGINDGHDGSGSFEDPISGLVENMTGIGLTASSADML